MSRRKTWMLSRLSRIRSANEGDGMLIWPRLGWSRDVYDTRTAREEASRRPVRPRGREIG
jgi:hypothetical protein